MSTLVQTVRFVYSHCIGRQGVQGTGFRFPVAAARGGGDLLYVVNRSNEYRPHAKRITVCTVDEEYVTEFAHGYPDQTETGELYTKDGTFIWPTDIALDKEGNIYISDEWNHRISIYTKDGDWIGKWGVPGRGDGQMKAPSGIAFGNDDSLYLVDSQNNRVQKFTRDGKFLAKWGRAGSDEGQFDMPWGIDVDSVGYVYVADWRNDRVQKFTSDGGFVISIGTSGTGPGELTRPTNVAVDKEGIIYVADWGNDRVQIFNPDGSLITMLAGDATVSKWGQAALDANRDQLKAREVAHDLGREKKFWGPVGLELDDQDRLFVVESARHRIQIYQKIPAVFTGIL